MSKAYEALADAFSQLNNLAKLKAQVAAGKDIWAEVSRTFLGIQLPANVRHASFAILEQDHRLGYVEIGEPAGGYRTRVPDRSEVAILAA